MIDVDKINSVIKKMSLEEKIGQLNQVQLNIKLNNGENLKEEIRQGRVGSVILAQSSTAGNDEQQRVKIDLLNEVQRIAVEESPSGIPLIFGRDVIHGHHTVMPIPLAIAAGFDMETAEKAYRAVAEEAAYDGIHWTFSPMIDISRDPRWGRCVEGFGEDPYLTARMGEAVIKGFQGEDNKKNDSVAACAKHFIGYGAVEGGRDYGKAEISDYTLRNYYLKPFQAAVQAGVATVMSSFNEISGQPMSSSRYLLHDVLKEELEFKGFIVSDWAAVEQLVWQKVAKNKKEAAMLCANAELDMDMVDRCYIESLSELVAEGLVKEETIDKMVYRVLYIKEKFGLFDNPYIKPKKIDYHKHLAIAKKCSDEVMVLLKNDNNALPVKKSEKIALAGPFLFEKRSHLGTWTLDFDISFVKSMAEAFADCADSEKLIFPQSQYLWDDILPRLNTAETVVIALGESAGVTGENNCIADIALPKEQLEFVKKVKSLGKKTIGVLCFGRPIGLGEAETYFDAILYAWHAGTCAASSIADIIYGKVNPSGKLPMTFPRNIGQIPIYYNYPVLSRNNMSYYGNGKNYHDIASAPMYPFGYGLSYTRFGYSKILCEKKMLSLEELINGEKFRLSVTVTNIGDVDGKETSQCYISDLLASMTRPVRELKGFAKNLLKQGESKKITFELGFNELGFYNARKQFCVEPGEFDIYIGTDCTSANVIRIEVI